MPDLILYIPNHGYSDDDLVYVSWLDANYYVSAKDNNSFKLATASGGSTLIQFSETLTDGFVRETSGVGITIITGLEHLEGMTVKITAGGRVVGTEVVSSGQVIITKEIFTYSAGMNYISTLQPMDLDIEGTGLSTTKRIHKVFVDLDETIGGTVGPSMDNQENIPTGSSPFTGFKEISYPGGYSRDTDITIRQPEPLPMTVLSITYELSASND